MVTWGNPHFSLVWIELCSSKICTVVLAPIVMVFGDGALGRQLGLAEVRRTRLSGRD